MRVVLVGSLVMRAVNHCPDLRSQTTTDFRGREELPPKSFLTMNLISLLNKLYRSNQFTRHYNTIMVKCIHTQNIHTTYIHMYVFTHKFMQTYETTVVTWTKHFYVLQYWYITSAVVMVTVSQLLVLPAHRRDIPVTCCLLWPLLISHKGFCELSQTYKTVIIEKLRGRRKHNMGTSMYINCSLTTGD